MPLANIRKRYPSENIEFRKQHILVIFKQISLNRWIWKNENIENQDQLAEVHKWIYEYINIWNICRQSRRTTPNRQTDAWEKIRTHSCVRPSVARTLVSHSNFIIFGQIKEPTKVSKTIPFPHFWLFEYS